MYPQVYPPNMLPVILEEEVFVGRETEIEELTDWIENSTIISIVGSPGFGKSTLAIHVGYTIADKGGIAVHYADLYEVQDMTTLKENLTFLVLGEKRQSSKELLMWASKLKVPTLFIFDNCDELLHKKEDAFQNSIEKLVQQSHSLKVMLTAKQMTSFLGSFRNFTLRELTSESAASVLQKLSSNVNRTTALEIASLVGNIPLALQVVGSLLKDIDPSIIANDLRRDPIPALSPELLPSTDRVYTSLNISYHYLNPEHQKCGRLLANFPGSFDENAVQGILGRELAQDPSKCLRELWYKSLLTYDTHTQQYRYHQLIKMFFTHIPQVYPPNMLPVKGEVFVGRETELEVLTDWIGSSTVTIISIVGSPGFGKSTLAIHVGHAIAEKGGIAVHYVDLDEVQDMTTLNKKLTFLVLGEKRQSSDYLLMWASKLKVPSIFIFDNCDELLHKNKDPFQNSIKKLVRRSHFLKVMLTAKQMTLFLGSFRNFTLRELSAESSASVLLKLSNSLNRTTALEIAGLVGNVPLALQVVGSLLKDIDPSIIANDLRRDPIPALSPELLPSTDRVYTSLNISYHYLSPEHQKCGRLLANFPGSFDESAVQGILGRELAQDPSTCLRELRYKSLLTYDSHTQRYKFHQLIKEFFTFEFKGIELLIQNEVFYEHFEDYYARLGSSCKDEPKEWFDSIDEERPNYDFLTNRSLEKCPDGVTSLAEFSFNLTKYILDTLHWCESMSILSRKPLYKWALASETIKSLPDIKETLIRIMTKPLPTFFLQDLDQEHPLRHFVETIYTPRQQIAGCMLYILNGDIDEGIALGIKIGQSGLANFDSNYKGIVMYAGISVYLEMYVDLLIQLSKLEGITQDKQTAVETLLLRYNRVTELFSFAPANNLENHQLQIKYHSALAHNYILLGQFNHFIEQWKKIIQLKWPLAQCKQVGCTPTQLALAHFGQGDYEQSVKQMKVLLKSKSLQGNRRVRLFILLHESYMRLGNVEGAAKLLTKDHYLSMFP